MGILSGYGEKDKIILMGGAPSKTSKINTTKIFGSFVDCVYGTNLYKQNISKIKNKLINKLPDKRICELANILMIDTKYDMYAVKIRMCDTKEDGSIDIDEIHKRIMDSDFIEISKSDYRNQIGDKSEMDMNDWRSIINRTSELISVGENVIFKMKDLDVNTLI